MLAGCMVAVEQSRERKFNHFELKILAIAAHQGPTPAFQTLKLDRACLGSIPKGSQYSGDGQKACSQGFQKCIIFAQQTGPRKVL